MENVYEIKQKSTTNSEDKEPNIAYCRIDEYKRAAFILLLYMNSKNLIPEFPDIETEEDLKKIYKIMEIIRLRKASKEHGYPYIKGQLFQFDEKRRNSDLEISFFKEMQKIEWQQWPLSDIGSLLTSTKEEALCGKEYRKLLTRQTPFNRMLKLIDLKNNREKNDSPESSEARETIRNMKKETRETIKNLRLFDPTCCIAAVIEIYAMLQECKLQPEGDWLYVFTPEQYKRKVLAAVLSIMDITGMNITGVSRINKWNEFKSAWLNKKQPSHCYTIGDARMSKKSLDSLCELAQEVSGARPALVFVSNISHKRPPKQYWQITSSDAEFFKSVNSVYFFKSAYSECKCRVITGKKNSIKADIEITRKADIEITPSKKPISPMLRDFKCSRGSSLWDNHGLLLLKDDSEIQDAMWNNLTGYIKTYCCKKEIEWRGNRKCLWLKDANKTDLSNNPWLKPRLEAIDIYRKAKRTEKNSIRGECHEFGIIRQPSSGYYLALPYIKYNERKHYKGKYIIGAVLSSTEEIAGEDLLVVTNAKQDTDSIYFAFAIASTQAFKIWFDMIMADSSRKIRTSFNIWNTFPFPQIGTNKLEFIKTAKEVLAKREELRNLGKNLPVIYSDLAKYQSLKEAHLELDELSLIAFGLPLNLNVATAIGRHKLENALRDSYEKLSSSRASQHSIDSV